MRNIGDCETAEAAQLFSGYLLSLHIGNEIRESTDKWALWVYSEDDIARASQEFAAFVKDPSAPHYRVAPQPDVLIPKPAPGRAGLFSEEPRLSARRVFSGRAPITTGLIAISVAVTALPMLGQTGIASYLSCDIGAILQGQAWRVITPIFVHFGILHILFNMILLQYLGAMIETIKGPRFLLGLTLVIAASSNLLQAILAGPTFGGMSGVGYGLFGYVWMKSRYEPFSGLLMDQTTVVLMVAWFILGMTGFAGPVANWVHGAGLVVGMAFGAAPTAWARIKRR
jgi:GlpG protein